MTSCLDVDHVGFGGEAEAAQDAAHALEVRGKIRVARLLEGLLLGRQASLQSGLFGRVSKERGHGSRGKAGLQQQSLQLRDASRAPLQRRVVANVHVLHRVQQRRPVRRKALGHRLQLAPHAGAALGAPQIGRQRNAQRRERRHLAQPHALHRPLAVEGQQQLQHAVLARALVARQPLARHQCAPRVGGRHTRQTTRLQERRGVHRVQHHRLPLAAQRFQLAAYLHQLSRRRRFGRSGRFESRRMHGHLGGQGLHGGLEFGHAAMCLKCGKGGVDQHLWLDALHPHQIQQHRVGNVKRRHQRLRRSL
jgi:hypothetical protein